jgi:hypothetical protein
LSVHLEYLLLLYASWEAGKVKKGFDSGATSNKSSKCAWRVCTGTYILQQMGLIKTINKHLTGFQLQ